MEINSSQWMRSGPALSLFHLFQRIEVHKWQTAVKIKHFFGPRILGKYNWFNLMVHFGLAGIVSHHTMYMQVISGGYEHYIATIA